MGVVERKKIEEQCSKCFASQIHNAEKKMQRCCRCSLWKDIEREKLEMIAEQEALLTPKDLLLRKQKSEERKRKYEGFY